MPIAENMLGLLYISFIIYNLLRVFCCMRKLARNQWNWDPWCAYFMALLHRGKKWGVLPFTWYWTSALPRTLLSAYPFALLSPMEDMRTRPILFVGLASVFLFSNLAHKEPRLLYPVLPLFNICAAVQIVRMFQNRWKSLGRRILAALAVASMLMMAVVSSSMLWVSVHNYPGGVALQKLHDLEGFSKWHTELPANSTALKNVHIGVFPAMTGASRFGEHGQPWRYSQV